MAVLIPIKSGALMNSKSKRQQIQERNRRQKTTANLIWGGIGAVVFVIIGLIVWQVAKSEEGEAIPIMATSHITTDSDPGTYNSDPPTSGLHYPEEANAQFYESNDYKFPAGYLVHNLEHGYVIFWYNCGVLDEAGCASLKEQIKATMKDLGGRKLIAYPWPSLKVPLVLTSWGRMEKFESFDANKAKAFYRANLSHSPEPDAP
jgi:hypothetical protein